MTGAPAGAWAVVWAQTEIDGMSGLSFAEMTVGAEWLWRGEAVRLDAPSAVMPLGEALGRGELRRRAGRRAARLTGLRPRSARAETAARDLSPDGFAVTDGRRSWCAQWLAPSSRSACIALFDDGLPPRDTALWVVATKRRALRQALTAASAVPQQMCGLAEGTLIATPAGWRPVETLRPGDLVLTQDAGPQRLLETASRHLSGLRIRLEPALAPIRIGAGSLGPDRPKADLLLSPNQRVMVRGGAAPALFGAPEVTVAADDLSGASDPRDARVFPAAGVTYHALTLAPGPAGPHLIRAAGLWCESLDVAVGGQTCGRPALTRGEAAILALGG